VKGGGAKHPSVVQAGLQYRVLPGCTKGPGPDAAGHPGRGRLSCLPCRDHSLVDSGMAWRVQHASHKGGHERPKGDALCRRAIGRQPKDAGCPAFV
jgi:hypothetical protein